MARYSPCMCLVFICANLDHETKTSSSNDWQFGSRINYPILVYPLESSYTQPSQHQKQLQSFRSHNDRTRLISKLCTYTAAAADAAPRRLSC